MSQSFYFRLPLEEDRGIDYGKVGALLCCIPPTWSHLSGILSAPTRLVEATDPPRVATLTGLYCSRSAVPKPVGLVARGNSTEEFSEFDISRYPDANALLIRHLLPRILWFSDTGFSSSDNPSYSFRMAAELAAHHIANWQYTGHLRFIARVGEYMDQISATVRLRLQPWEGSGDEAGPQPARLRVNFDPKHGGTLVEIEPVLTACRDFGFTEYQPVAQPNPQLVLL